MNHRNFILCAALMSASLFSSARADLEDPAAQFAMGYDFGARVSAVAMKTIGAKFSEQFETFGRMTVCGHSNDALVLLSDRRISEAIHDFVFDRRHGFDSDEEAGKVAGAIHTGLILYAHALEGAARVELMERDKSQYCKHVKDKAEILKSQIPK